MEFGVLSRVTGDKKYEQAAKLSSLELYHRRSRIGLYGRHINSKVGAWTEAMAGVGSHIDSKPHTHSSWPYVLRFLRISIQGIYPSERHRFAVCLGRFQESRIVTNLKMIQFTILPIMSQHLYNHGFWLTGVNMQNGKFLHDEIDNLSLFWMGLLVLNGDVNAILAFEWIY